MEALPLLERAAVFRLIESVSASQKYRHEEGSCLTWHWTKDHHIVVLHEVAGETPVDKSAITGSSEGAGIEDVCLVSFREADPPVTSSSFPAYPQTLLAFFFYP